jgi:hypothetical protein
MEDRSPLPRFPAPHAPHRRRRLLCRRSQAIPTTTPPKPPDPARIPPPPAKNKWITPPLAQTTPTVALLGCVRVESSPVRHTDSRRPSYMEALLSARPALPVKPIEGAGGPRPRQPQVSPVTNFREAESRPAAPPQWRIRQTAAQIGGGRSESASSSGWLSGGAQEASSSAREISVAERPRPATTVPPSRPAAGGGHGW